GVREGGVLEHVLREVTVEALPTDIPDSLSMDVSDLEINDTATMSRLVVPAGVELVVEDPDEVTVVTVSPPRVEEEPVAAEVEEEVELVGEGEEEEGAEGEAEGEAPAAEEESPEGE
ncbi:MAG: 50S ribosomal protein L25, partial [Solirubrobacterales bacterium]